MKLFCDNVNNYLSTYDLKCIESFICDLNIENMVEECELKNFLFGRNTIYSYIDGERNDSVFEKILATPNSGYLIEKIWKTFNLSKREEVLIQVSKLQ